MPRSVRAKVKPEILVWARESAGYTLAEATEQLDIAEEKLFAWESGQSAPTISQLQGMASAYKRPLSVFYLQVVPRTFSVMRDFRRLPGTGIRHVSPNLAQEIRIAQQRRQLALELMEESVTKVLTFRLSATLDDDAETLGEGIRHALGITHREQKEWRRDRQGYAAFNAWRAAIESLGVLVFQTTRVSEEEVSGFAIANSTFPVIVINPANTPPTRRTFSLLHEFIHILLHQSGVSDLEVDAARPPEDQKVEVFCNRVAAATLIPKNHLIAEKAVVEHGSGKEDWTDEVISELARNYSVSREALVRRLLTFNLVSNSFYERKRQQYAEEYRQKRQIERERFKKQDEIFFPNPPRDALTHIGRPLVKMILDSYYRERLSLSDVSGFLGIRTRHVSKLENLVSSRE
jgi:Zn-dependent peptidase ImmA (M78 family)